MNEEELYNLIEKAVSGSATEEELRVLHKWYQSAAGKEVAWPDGEDAPIYELRNRMWHYIRQNRSKRPMKKVNRVAYTQIAAVFITVLVGIWALYRFADPGSNKPQVLASVVSHGGKVKKILLPDGSVVWLNAGSTLQYDSTDYGKKARDVLLSGEAFFDVKHDVFRPFVVRTAHIHIAVLGTAFNVKDRPGNDIIEASLIRGRIALGINSDAVKKEFILHPNQKFVWTANAQPTATASTTNRSTSAPLVKNIVPILIGAQQIVADTSWIAGEIVFEDRELQAIVPELAQKYGIDIHIRNPAVASYKYTGIIKEESIEQVLEALSLIRPFKYNISKNKIEIE